MAPAAIVRARASSTSYSFAIFFDELFESRPTAETRLPSSRVSPTTLRRARAVPPTAIAVRADGVSTPANDVATAFAARATSSASGGSDLNARPVRRSEPRSTD
jgi:hypothetical protein